MSRLSTYAAALGRRGPKPWPGKWPPYLRLLPQSPSPTGTQPPEPQARCWSATGDYVERSIIAPAGPDIDFERGQFCPWLPPGLRRIYPDRDTILLWDLVFYDDAELDVFFAKYVADGGTHVLVSAQQTLNNGKTFADLQRVMRAARRWGLWITYVAFGAKYERGTRTPCNDYFQTWARVLEWLEPLRQEGLVDKIVGCWQSDFWWSPFAELEEVMFPLALYGKRHQIEIIRHNGVDGGWWADAADDPVRPSTWSEYGIHDADTYSHLLGPIGSGLAQQIAARLGPEYLALEGEIVPGRLYWQGGPNASIDDVQGTAAKVLGYQAGTGRKVVLSEIDADEQFQPGQDPRTQDYGDKKTALALGAIGNGERFQGYFNARYVG